MDTNCLLSTVGVCQEVGKLLVCWYSFEAVVQQPVFPVIVGAVPEITMDFFSLGKVDFCDAVQSALADFLSRFFDCCWGGLNYWVGRVRSGAVNRGALDARHLVGWGEGFESGIYDL